MFRKIIGLDLLPGESPQATHDLHLAYVLMVEGEVRERGTANLHEILSIIEKERIEVIAIDNIYEIAPSLSEIQSLLGSLSSPPRLVQVTMIGGKSYPLSSLAASLGLGNGKLSPSQAAEIAAKLCYMGIGSELQLFEQGETRIIISKGRTPAQGGMSVERFRRNIESRISNKTKEIQKLLKDRGIDFDLFITKGAYGVERSVFIVYTPRERLYGVVKPIKDHDLQVAIEPVARREPSFAPLGIPATKHRKARQYLIVGVDPGISTGVAAITLDGKLKLLLSGRELGRGQVIRALLEVGTPLVVSTDVTPPPGYARKLATMLNAVLVAPPRTLTIEDKRQLVSHFSASLPRYLKVRDSHQRDALAAAIFALRQLQPKLNEAKEKIERLGLGIPVEEVEALIIKGASVWDAIRQISRNVLIPSQKVSIDKYFEQYRSQNVEIISEKVTELYNKVKKLEREKESLIAKLKEVETQLERLLQLQSFEVRRNKEVETLRNRLDKIIKDFDLLREQVEFFKNQNEKFKSYLLKAATGQVVIAPRLGSPSAAFDLIYPCDIVVFGALTSLDSQHLREICRRLRIRAIISEQDFPKQLAEELACDDIAVLSLNDIKPLDVIDTVYLFNREDLENIINQKLKELEESSKKYVKKLVKNIIDNYRTDRLKILSD